MDDDGGERAGDQHHARRPPLPEADHKHDEDGREGEIEADSRGIAEKRAENIARAREASRSCPGGCGTQLMPADLLAHVEERCPGPRDPHAGARWVTWAEALVEVRKRGLSRKALWKWIQRGVVRHRGAIGERLYLYADLADEIARIIVVRRRQFPNGNPRKL